MKIEIIGMPLDLGADRRGVDMGPSAIRIAGIAEHLKDLGFEVIDSGDVSITSREVQTVEDPKLKYVQEISRALNRLFDMVTQCLGKNHFPLVLGGDHSIAVGTISAVSAHLRTQDKKTGVIWIDAHGDINTPDTSPSGNIHGMSLAALLGKEIPEIAQIGGDFTKIEPDNSVLVGVRNLDPMEQTLIKDSGIHVYSMEEVDHRGMYDVITEAVDIASQNTGAVHLSLDMDAVDPKTAPGVGTPVRGGLTYREAHTAMEAIAESGRLTSMEVVEVNPILDTHNATAELAVELVDSALGKKLFNLALRRRERREK
jgi:arginase